MWPLINKTEITKDVLYLSKKEAIKDLKEKIFRIYNLNYEIEDRYKNPGNSRIWKIESKSCNEHVIDTLKAYTNSKKNLVIKGKKLEDSTPLEV